MDTRQSFASVMMAFLVLNGITVSLRLYVRITQKTLGYDDYATCIAVVAFILFCTFEFEALRFGYGANEMKPEYNMLKAAEFFVIAQLLYLLAQLFAKISVALVLFRIASKTGLRKFLAVSVAVLSVWSTVSILIFGLQCRPLSVAWGVGEGECLPGSTIAQTAYAISAMDIGFSWLYALVPVYMLWGVHISLRTKIGVTVLLGLGVVSCVATIVRLSYVIEVGKLPSTADPRAVDFLLGATIYSALEIGLAIFCASLAALKPLLKCLPWGTTDKGVAHCGSDFANNDRLESLGSAFRLEGRKWNTGSEEGILPTPAPRTIHKTTRLEASYGERS